MQISSSVVEEEDVEEEATSREEEEAAQHLVVLVMDTENRGVLRRNATSDSESDLELDYRRLLA